MTFACFENIEQFTYFQSISENNPEHLSKYKDMEAICNGMSSAMKFLKNPSNVHENLINIRQSLPSLEFIIGDLAYIRNIIEFLSDKLPEVSDNEENLMLAEGKIFFLLL